MTVPIHTSAKDLKNTSNRARLYLLAADNPDFHCHLGRIFGRMGTRQSSTGCRHSHMYSVSNNAKCRKSDRSESTKFWNQPVVSRLRKRQLRDVFDNERNAANWFKKIERTL